MIKFYVGDVIGSCSNCGCKVQIRQPWLSKQPIVNDGWYLVHCTNRGCHNYFGMEIREDEIEYLDFLVSDNDTGCLDNKNLCRVIQFQDYAKDVCYDKN